MRTGQKPQLSHVQLPLVQPMMFPQCIHMSSMQLVHSFLPLYPVWMTLASLLTCQEQTLDGSWTTSWGVVVSFMGMHAGLADELNMAIE